MSSLDPEVLNIARQNREFYLCALTAPTARRPALLALTAYGQELARIAQLVSEPMLGRIRLQWWIDAMPGITGGRPPSHPVAGGLAEAAGAAGLALDDLRAVAVAHNFDYDEGPVTMDALLAYAQGRGGMAQALVCQALGVRDAATIQAAQDIGTALVLVDGVQAPQRELADGVAKDAIEQARALLVQARKVPSERGARPALALARLVERRLDLGLHANLGAGAVLSIWWAKLSGRV